jgi:hypothetical protein
MTTKGKREHTHFERRGGGPSGRSDVMYAPSWQRVTARFKSAGCKNPSDHANSALQNLCACKKTTTLLPICSNREPYKMRKQTQCSAPFPPRNLPSPNQLRQIHTADDEAEISYFCISRVPVGTKNPLPHSKSRFPVTDPVPKGAQNQDR